MRTKRVSLLVAVAGATGVICAAAVAGALAARPAAHAAGAAKVELRHTRLGAILTSASGLTLYEFTRDRRDEDSCAKVAGCLREWPALVSGGQPSAGTGVKASLLSTIRLAGGARQVTYAGHPLYTFTDDTPGEVSYVGEREFGGTWDALSAGGTAIR